MASSATRVPGGTGERSRAGRWGTLALVVLCLAQLMIVLDTSVVIVALPSAQRALHISAANRQWVVTVYSLVFGSLLLLGGRIADYLGRRRMFIVGLIGFAMASAIGGLAQDQAMLFGARAVQGAFAALMAPAALSLITTTFTETRARARAFALYGSVAAGGAAIGLILGGVLTEYASWRWTLLINTPIALLTAVAAGRLLQESKATRSGSYDIFGAVLATGSLFLLIYGFTLASTDGWGSGSTVAVLAASGVGLVGFILRELWARHPLLPLRVVLDRNRGGAFLAALLVGTALLGTFLFLTYYFQNTRHDSALVTGFAFLPFSAGAIVGAAAAGRLLPRLGPRVLLVVGLAAGALGLGWLTQLGATSSYALHVLPGEVLASLGLGLAFVTMSNTALVGIDPGDAGVASALVNATQQVGGSLGTALLNTIATSAAAAYVLVHGSGVESETAGAIHGYTVAFATSAALLLLASVIAGLLVRSTRPGVGYADADADAMPEAGATEGVPALEPTL